MEVIIDGKPQKLKKVIGQGGTAVIYALGSSKVAKVFKMPDHQDYLHDQIAQEGAKMRLKEMQKKLPAFPNHPPSEVVAPLSMIKEKKGRIIGYTMSLVKDGTLLYKYTDKKFRITIPDEEVAEILRNLHQAFSSIHRANIVMGDANDLNVMATPDKKVSLIDADSFQFSQFPCRLYTTRFVDPTLCDPKGDCINLVKPHGNNSDWYVFCVMVFQCFLYVHPYGGIYKPKDKSKKIKHDLRPLHRITVFNKEVGYPKPARPYDFFSDEILQHFFQTFEKDERGEFPFRLIEGMAWKRPDHAPAQAAVISVITVRGNVTAEKTFTTKGSILKAVMQNDKLRYLYHENETYYREDKQKVCSGKIERGARFGIRGEKTIIGKKDKVVCLDKTGKPEIFPTSKFENVPSFDANGDSVFWIQDGELRKELEKIRKK